MSDEPIRMRDGLPELAIEKRTLPCGLDVILHRDHAVPQVAVSVWYRVGSSDDRPDRTGFAHLFEHLFKLPPERLGGFHHYDVLKRAGATDTNASTGSDRTAYHEVVPTHQLSLALWMEAGRMGYFAHSFDEQRLVLQQSVVRNERRQRYEDVPYGPERFALAAALYPEGHPARYLTIGRHEDIQAATVDDVLAYYRTWYVPANATLVMAGDIPDDVDALLDEHFGAFPFSTRPSRPTPTVPTPTAHRERLPDKFAVLRRIHRAWHGPAAYATDEPDLDVLVAGWAAVGTGALWRRLVYETQLAQRVEAYTTNTRIGGEVHVSVDLRSGSDPDAVRAILDEECAKGVDASAIERAVTRREARTLWSLTAMARRSSTLQRAALYDTDGLAADLARYRHVTPASVDRARATWVNPAHAVEIETVPAGDRRTLRN